VDDDGPALSVGDQSVTEGETNATVQFTVSLASPAGALTTVDYATADVSASAGSDYVATRARSRSRPVLPAPPSRSP